MTCPEYPGALLQLRHWMYFVRFGNSTVNNNPPSPVVVLLLFPLHSPPPPPDEKIPTKKNPQQPEKIFKRKKTNRRTRTRTHTGDVRCQAGACASGRVRGMVGGRAARGRTGRPIGGIRSDCKPLLLRAVRPFRFRPYAPTERRRRRRRFWRNRLGSGRTYARRDGRPRRRSRFPSSSAPRRQRRIYRRRIPFFFSLTKNPGIFLQTGGRSRDCSYNKYNGRTVVFCIYGVNKLL